MSDLLLSISPLPPYRPFFSFFPWLAISLRVPLITLATVAHIDRTPWTGWTGCSAGVPASQLNYGSRGDKSFFCFHLDDWFYSPVVIIASVFLLEALALSPKPRPLPLLFSDLTLLLSLSSAILTSFGFAVSSPALGPAGALTKAGLCLQRSVQSAGTPSHLSGIFKSPVLCQITGEDKIHKGKTIKIFAGDGDYARLINTDPDVCR